MSFSNISLFIDIIGSVLLGAVIFYTIRLNQHFQMLQKNRAELARQLSGFAHSTERAEMAIQQVRQSTKESAQQMEELLKNAEMLKQDLGYLVDRGNGLADRLEGNIRRNRETPAEAGAGGRRSRRSGAAAEAPANKDAPVAPKTSRRSRGTAAAAIEPSMEETPSATPSRRRRRGASAENGDDQAGQSNSELLKVLQGMR